MEFFSGTGSEHDKVVSHVGSARSPRRRMETGNSSREIPPAARSAAVHVHIRRAGPMQVSNGQPGTFTASLGSVQGAGPHSLTAFTDRLSGSQSFPAHSDNWAVTHTDEDPTSSAASALVVQPGPGGPGRHGAGHLGLRTRSAVDQCHRAAGLGEAIGRFGGGASKAIPSPPDGGRGGARGVSPRFTSAPAAAEGRSSREASGR